MKLVRPSAIKGRVAAPHSKSVFQRAAAAACLARGESVLRASDLCADDRAALRAAAALGAGVEEVPGSVRIRGGGEAPGGTIDCGESGLCLRLFAALAALSGAEYLLRASGSLLSRPVGMLSGPLAALGASCRSRDGFPPLTVRGPLRGGNIELDGSVTSQFLTGLLLALPLCPEGSEIRVRELKSRPYVELTLETVRAFGGRIEAERDLSAFRIGGSQRYRPREMEIEGDWSAAAFLLAAGALAGEAEVSGLAEDSRQADRAVLAALGAAGAVWDRGPGFIRARGGNLRPFRFDASDCPDLFPPLAALALGCPGASEIAGAHRLRHKESDRAAALREEFAKLGGRIEVNGDIMTVNGCRLSGGKASARGDHRIAMALALGALTARGPVEIEGDESVAKSYPGFFRDLEKLGSGVR